MCNGEMEWDVTARPGDYGAWGQTGNTAMKR